MIDFEMDKVPLQTHTCTHKTMKLMVSDKDFDF